MKKRKFLICAAAALLVVLLAAPALAAPQESYTKTGLESEVTNGNLQKLWLTNTLMMQVLKDGKLVKGGDMLMYGEAIYCVDPTPINGYVLAYYYRWGYSSTGEVACFLKAVGYVPANCLTNSEPTTSDSGSYSGGGCGCSGGNNDGSCPDYDNGCGCGPYNCYCPGGGVSNSSILNVMSLSDTSGGGLDDGGLDDSGLDDSGLDDGGLDDGGLGDGE